MKLDTAFCNESSQRSDKDTWMDMSASNDSFEEHSDEYVTGEGSEEEDSSENSKEQGNKKDEKRKRVKGFSATEVATFAGAGGSVATGTTQMTIGAVKLETEGTAAVAEVTSLGGLVSCQLAGMASMSVALTGGVFVAGDVAGLGVTATIGHFIKTMGSSCGSIASFIPGNVIALHCSAHNRFLRMKDDEVNGFGGRKRANELPTDWASERFVVVDAGDGLFALFSPTHKRFLRLHGTQVNGKGGVLNITASPRECERFAIRDKGNDRISLYSPQHEHFVRMEPNGKVDGSADVAKAWEQYSVTHITGSASVAAFVPGNTIALHCSAHNRFLRMKDNEVNGFDGRKRVNELPTDWATERFVVVDAGDGLFALFSPTHKRFLRMHGTQVDGKGGVLNITASPRECERFAVRYEGNDRISLYSPYHEHFVRMEPNGNVDGNAYVAKTWEQYSVIHITGSASLAAFVPGNTIALHCSAHNRFLRMKDDEVNGFGGRKRVNELPTNWGSEKFVVVDAGDRLVALFSATQKRFLRMHGTQVDGKGGVQDVTVSLRECERFAIRYEGNDRISLYSPHHKHFVRMNPNGNVDGKADVAKTWELFSVVVICSA
jgi:hypothetical protein